MDQFDTGFTVLHYFAGPLMAIVSMLVAVTIVVPVLMYVIARWRANKEPQPDQHLGLKVALHYFAVTSLHLALAGLTLLIWTMISSGPSEMKSVFYRIAIGMLVPAVLVQAAHLQLLRRTNDAQLTGVRRLFTGYNLIITGLVGFIALVMAFQALLAKGSSGEVGRIAGAMVLVYGTAWAVIGWKLGQAVLPGGGANTGTGTLTMSAPQAGSSYAAVAPAPPTTGGLPALGGGAYPPIEPRS